MEKGFEKEEPANEKILKTLDEIEAEKEQKLTNLIVKIIVKATLKDYYEKGD